jgi:hypothetical protein
MMTLDGIIFEYFTEGQPSEEGVTQYIDGKWYAPRYGCDTIQMMLEEILGEQGK